MRFALAALVVLTALVVSFPAAAIEDVSPHEGYPGEELSVDVVGNPFVNPYEQGYQVAFDPDTDIDVIFTYRAYDHDDERLRSQIKIHANALPGPVDVLVIDRKGDVLERARNAFEILGTAALISATPDVLRQGTTVNVAIDATSTHFAFFDSQISVSSSGVDAEISSVLSDTALTASFTVDERASLGWRDVTVTTGTEQATGKRLIEIIERPTLKRADPDVLGQGQSTELVLVGSGTDFQDGDFVGISGTGVNVIGSSERLSSTKLKVNVDVDPRTAPGLRNVTVTTGSDVLTGEGLLTVEANISITPEELMQGDEADFQAVGGEGWFDNGLAVSAGERVDVDRVFYLDAYSATFAAAAQANAVVGPRKVTFSVGGQSVSGTLHIALNPLTTTLDAITPDAADAGVVDLAVTVLGTNTNFESAETRIGSPGGLLAGSAFTATSETDASGLVSVADEAQVGTIDVTVSTKYEHVTKVGGFTVTQPATVTSVQPGLIDAGASATVVVVASDGQFVDGATKVYVVGEGVSVDVVRVQDANTLEADISVDAEAEGTVRALKAVTGSRAAVGGELDVFHPALAASTPALYEGQANPVTLTAIDFDMTDGPVLSFDLPGITASEVSAADAGTLTFKATVPKGIGRRNAVLTVTVAGRSLDVPFSIRTRGSSGFGGDEGCGCGAGQPPATAGLVLLVLLGISRSRRAGR